MILALTAGEVDFIISTLTEEELGRTMRARFFAERLKMPQGVSSPNWVTIMDLDIETLWKIDNAIFINEPFSNYLYDQTPLKVLADKIWMAIALHEGEMTEEERARYVDDTYEAATARAEARQGGGEVAS